MRKALTLFLILISATLLISQVDTRGVWFRTTQPDTGVVVGQLWVDSDESPPKLRICTNVSPITFTEISGGGGGSSARSIHLFPGGVATDGTGSGNNTAALSYEVSTGTQTTDTPKATQHKLLFDGGTDEHWTFSFELPNEWTSGATLRGIVKFTSATSGTAIMKAGQVSTVNSSTNDNTTVFAAEDNSSSITAPGTLGQTVAFTITLTTTNMAAGRKIVIFIGRDTDNGSDTIATDLELLALNFEFTAG